MHVICSMRDQTGEVLWMELSLSEGLATSNCENLAICCIIPIKTDGGLYACVFSI